MTLTIEAEAVPLRADASGVLRVGGTRVTLDTVVGVWQEGATPEEIIQNYSSLDLDDVYATITYYLRHRTEVDEYLARGRDEAARARTENEARSPQSGLRERLLARRATQPPGERKTRESPARE